MRIAVIGNCHTFGLAKALSTICKDAICTELPVSPAFLKKSTSRIDLDDYDYVFINKFIGSTWDYLSYDSCKDKENIIFTPRISFRGSHPDCIYINTPTGLLQSPIGDYNSSIIANAFLSGLSEKECQQLFNPQFFRLLGYDKAYANGLKALKKFLIDQGIDGDFLVQKWASRGHFMHTTNHPKLFVLGDIAKYLCQKHDISYDSSVNICDFVPDNLMNNVIFPIYPGLGIQSSDSESLIFKAPLSSTENPGGNVSLLSLEELINNSYTEYRLHSDFENCISDTKRDAFKLALDKFNSAEPIAFEHPYRTLPDYNYWSRSIAKKNIDDVDPVVEFDFKISPSTKVATAGSCFAQHIARTLANSGMNYYVAETGPENLSSDEKSNLGFGLFSARYGNVYTSRQLLQLFDRAYGLFIPAETHWPTEDGFFIDPFRPNIGEKFNSVAELKADSDSHLSHVREMFENLDVFVFTLGLTEAWDNVQDGAIYPVPPGVISCNINESQYRFVNFDYESIINDLNDFISKLRFINPNAKIILTVSPVPLVATKEDRHVLTSTILSKSILRVAADKISRSYSFVSYFPSYEIITGNFNRGSYYASDLRSVLDNGVNHVMRLFMKHCTDLGISQKCQTKQPYEEDLASKELKKELEVLSEVICDEDLLEL